MRRHVSGMDETKAGPAESWHDRFLKTHLRRHPVDATFIGLHEHDRALPPIGREQVEETLGLMRGLLARSMDPEPGETAFQRLDRRLARGFLKTRIWELESGHVLGNPSTHVGDAVFGLMGPLLSEYAPLTERLDAVRSRMAALPEFLDAARQQVTLGRSRGGGEDGVPAAWTRRAMRECEAGARFLREGVRLLDGGRRQTHERAARAFERFQDFLEREVLPGGTEAVACGPEAFDLYLREGHFLSRSAAEIVEYARAEMARTRSWLEASVGDFGAKKPARVLAALADRHPSPEGYLDRYRETWEAMRTLALDLVTWPDFPIEYVPIPDWARAAAPDLYFLFYRSPAAFNRPAVHRYRVAPLDPTLPREEQEAFLRANNDSVIKLNHVVHHGGIGHHVQNWHAFRSPSRIGRIAAVDCASRIAMFCGGTMAEGWACYATDLMAEAGALTERERYAEGHARVRMCARAVVDVELHHGRMTLREAAAFYRSSARMSPAAASAETVKNSMFPGAALMYLVGTDMIHELRADLARALGDDLTLRDFHDALLSYGSMPVKLIADEMRRRAALGLPLGAHDELTKADAHDAFR